MNKNWDLTLQFLFVVGLVLLAGAFYLTRLAPSRAGGEIDEMIDPYQLFSSVYQFEQEENRLETKIKVLKADYASDLSVFLSEKAQLDASQGLSQLEKREKLKVLEELYSTAYFQRKLDLIDQELRTLERLRQLKCAKYCLYQDLPNDL